MINIEKTLELIESYVGVSKIEKKLLGEVMTSKILVNEMVDKIPVEFWSNPDFKILDPSVGTGIYPLVVIQRYMKGLEQWQPDPELRYKHIIENMIHVCELQPKNMFIYLQLFDPFHQYKMNYYRGSFLDEGFDNWMKEKGVDGWDLILTNPPYQDGSGSKKRSLGAKKNLYQQFIKKSLNMLKNNAYLTFVNPVGFLKMTDFEKPNDIIQCLTNMQVLFIKLHVQYYFKDANPGEICYFLIRNNEEKILTKIYDDVLYEFPFYKYKFIPTTIRQNTINIFDKIINNGERKIELKREVNKDKLNEYKFISMKMMNNRLAGLKSIPHNDNDDYKKDSILIMITENPENLCSILNSKIFSFINKSYNFDAIIYHKFYNQFGIPNDDKLWNDDELYKYYNLTEEEIKLIEETIK